MRARHSSRALITGFHTKIALPAKSVSLSSTLEPRRLQVPYTDTRLLLGSSDHFDSPKKQYFPGLRPPQGQRHLFTTASMKPVPFRKTSFTTPQNSIDAEFSSPLNPSSPMNADSEDTPEPQMPSAMQKSNGKIIPFEGNNSEKKHSSSNLFARSGRGEIATIKPYSNAGACKVDKRRRRLMDRDVRSAPRRSSNEWDSEERRSSSEGKSHKKESPTRQMSFIPSVLTFIDEHPGLPSTLSIYVQFLFNCFIALCLMYVLYGMFSTLRHDIDEKAMMESSEILAEMAVCAREFKENRCERESRVPAMETVCNSWEKCMARDPYMVGRSRLSAGMFAEIFNSFIEPISWKAIVSLDCQPRTICLCADTIFNSWSAGQSSLAVLRSTISVLGCTDRGSIHHNNRHHIISPHTCILRLNTIWAITQVTSNIILHIRTIWLCRE